MTAVCTIAAADLSARSSRKAAGTIVLGSHQPRRADDVDDRAGAPALLAALVVYETFPNHGEGLIVDARAAGLGAAIVALLARAPMIVVILLAAAVTARVRAFS